MAVEVPVDRFGDPLPERAVRRFGTLRFWNPVEGDWNGIESLAVSPDGRLVATAGRGGTVLLWEIATGREVRRLLAPPEPSGHIADGNFPHPVAFTPDGLVLVAGGSRGRVERWDVESGERLAPFTGGHDYDVLRLAFSGDGTILATGDLDGVILVRDAADGRIRFGLGPHRYPVAVLAIASDGRTLIAGWWTDSSVVSAWDVASGRLVRELEIDYVDKRNYSVALSPDGALVAVGRGDYEIVVWDLRTGKVVVTLEERQEQDVQFDIDPHESHDQVAALAFSPDGGTLASAGRDSSVRLWDVATWSERMRLDWRDGQAEAVAFTPDGATLVAAGSFGVVRAWALPEGRERIRTTALRATPSRLAWTPDGRSVVALAGDGAVCLLDTTTGQDERTVILPRIRYAVALSYDGRLVAFQGLLSDRRVSVVETSTGRLRHTFDLRGEEGFILLPRFSPDGGTLLVGDEERDDERELIVAYDLATGAEAGRIEASESYFRALALSPDGRLLAARSDANDVFVYDYPSGRLRHRLRHNPDASRNVFLRQATFSPDGRLLAVVDHEGDVHLWDPVSGRALRTLAEASRVAFSPDGERLAAASPNDSFVRIWDVKTGREVDRLEGHPAGVRCLAFAPDGRRLATGGFDTTVLIWQL